MMVRHGPVSLWQPDVLVLERDSDASIRVDPSPPGSLSAVRKFTKENDWSECPCVRPVNYALVQGPAGCEPKHGKQPPPPPHAASPYLNSGFVGLCRDYQCYLEEGVVSLCLVYCPCS